MIHIPAMIPPFELLNQHDAPSEIQNPLLLTFYQFYFTIFLPLLPLMPSKNPLNNCLHKKIFLIGIRQKNNSWNPLYHELHPIC